MHKSIKRDKQEIDEMTKKGEEFVKEHPQSMFGDDNTQPFEDFKELIKMAKEGKSIEELRDWIEEEYGEEDEDLEEKDENDRLREEAETVIQWLSGESDELYP